MFQTTWELMIFLSINQRDSNDFGKKIKYSSKIIYLAFDIVSYRRKRSMICFKEFCLKANIGS